MNIMYNIILSTSCSSSSIDKKRCSMSYYYMSKGDAQDFLCYGSLISLSLSYHNSNCLTSIQHSNFLNTCRKDTYDNKDGEIFFK